MRKDELTILIWERKVLRRIFGPVCERGMLQDKNK
jgi:hypothetical protein